MHEFSIRSRRPHHECLWVIGLLVGIEMFFSGFSWLMLGLALRATPRIA